MPHMAPMSWLLAIMFCWSLLFMCLSSMMTTNFHNMPNMMNMPQPNTYMWFWYSKGYLRW